MLALFNLFLSKIKSMSAKEEFFEHIESGYSCKGDFIVMGAAMLDGETINGAHVKVP